VGNNLIYLDAGFSLLRISSIREIGEKKGKAIPETGRGGPKGCEIV
jgi:hypothetical protein